MKSKHFAIGAICAGAVCAAAATQVSVLRLGTESYGSTVLVLRTDELKDLRLFDSAKAACERKGAVARVLGSTFMCEGALAMKIMSEKRALLRWGVRGA